jgi:hypothetical protein
MWRAIRDDPLSKRLNRAIERSRVMRIIGRPSCIVLSLLASTSVLLAADSTPAAQENAPARRSIAGLQVAVDPSTGRLIAPTPEQRAKLAAALAQMIDHRTAGLEVRRRPDGTRLVDLRGRFQSVEVATLGTDGAVHLRCIDSPDELDQPATEER